MLHIVCCKQIVRESSSGSFCEVALLENGCTHKILCWVELVQFPFITWSKGVCLTQLSLYTQNTVLGGVSAVSFYYLIERSMSNLIVIVILWGGICLWSWILLGLTVVMETLSCIVVAQLPLLHDYSSSSFYWRQGRLELTTASVNQRCRWWSLCSLHWLAELP